MVEKPILDTPLNPHHLLAGEYLLLAFAIIVFACTWLPVEVGAHLLKAQHAVIAASKTAPAGGSMHHRQQLVFVASEHSLLGDPRELA